MIYDCFIFYNELDLLKVRLELYKDKVDFFVICEANMTHSGQPKPYNYLENIDVFQEYKDKIIYIPVELDVTGLNIDYKPTQLDFNSAFFNLEEQHRRGLTYAFSNIQDDDIVLLSDLDEFPSYQILDYLKENIPNNPVALIQQLHYYYINCMNIGYDSQWRGTIAINGKQAKENDGQSLRQLRGIVPCIPNAGWHFSYLGGVEKIKDKIKSYSHQEFNNDYILNNENITLCLKEGKDIFMREGVKYKFNPLTEYPDYILKIFSKYPQFIYND